MRLSGPFGLLGLLGLLGLTAVAGCSRPTADTAQLTLRDPSWDRVSVEIVITKRADCDSRDEGFISTREVVLRRKGYETIDVPAGATVCWRHDRDPNKPVAGAWTGWTRATLVP